MNYPDLCYLMGLEFIFVVIYVARMCLAEEVNARVWSKVHSFVPSMLLCNNDFLLFFKCKVCARFECQEMPPSPAAEHFLVVMLVSCRSAIRSVLRTAPAIKLWSSESQFASISIALLEILRRCKPRLLSNILSPCAKSGSHLNCCLCLWLFVHVSRRM
jgi:hypothetical protein